MVKLVNFTADDYRRAYTAYDSGLYEVFFRHFQPFLNLEEFANCFANFGRAQAILADGEYAGFILTRIFHRPKIADVSILIEKPYQRQGVAVKAVVEAGMHLVQTGVNKVTCHTAKGDIRTDKLLREAGFEAEACLKDNCFYSGGLDHEVRWSITAEEAQRRYS